MAISERGRASRPGPAYALRAGESPERLTKAIAKLPVRGQQVLMLCYEQVLIMREVGELMGVGDSRVSQIHTLAVKHLAAVCGKQLSIVSCR